MRFHDNRTYVYTNPEPHHVVRKEDKLFVLSLYAGNATGSQVVTPRRQFKLTT